jgi:hypothetical protein
VPKIFFFEFSALLQAQRQRSLDEVREKIAASGEGLDFANQSKICAPHLFDPGAVTGRLRFVAWWAHDRAHQDRASRCHRRRPVSRSPMPTDSVGPSRESFPSPTTCAV